MQLTTIFYSVDEFCKLFEQVANKRGIECDGWISRQRRLSLSEVMTIMIYYHYSGYKSFKDYYEKCVLISHSVDFPSLVSYNRFVELREEAALPVYIFTQAHCKGLCTGISIIDSTPLSMSNVKRASSHKIFKKYARKGKTSVGWFFGFKLHIVINHFGEIIAFHITPGNVADSNKSLIDKISDDLYGLLIADRGYIGCFDLLWEKCIKIIHKIRKNMQNKLMLPFEKFLLRKRGIIETVFGILKESFSLEHSRHRSILGFIAHIGSCLAAYFFKIEKPEICLLEGDLLTIC